MAHDSISRRRKRPFNYRTPSPPPFSPILSPIDGAGGDEHNPTRPGSPSLSQLTQAFNLDQNQNITISDKQASQTSVPGRSGHRSARSMDTFASIALATQYANPPSAMGKRASEATHHNERTKRSKNTYTSYGISQDARQDLEDHRIRSPEIQMEEAQLLLDFAIEARARELKTPKYYEVQNLRESPASPTTQTSVVVSTTDDTFSGTLHKTNTPKATTFPDSEYTVAEQQPPNSLSPFQSSPPDPHDLPRCLSSSREIEMATETSVCLLDEPVSYMLARTVSKRDERPRRDLMRAVPLERSASEPSTSPLAAMIRPIRSSSELPTLPNAEMDEALLGEVFHPRKRKVSFADELTVHQQPDADLKTATKQIAGHDFTEQLGAVTSQSAVCAACNFAKNSLNIDSDHSATCWINCDGCKSWFHFACAGFKTEREVRAVDKFRCKKCKPLYGSTSYVRKSSRAHASIDYAGLHQGVIKSSDDRPEHHYIAPIKSGATTFQPETFPRMSPELVTAEFFEKGGGMREPVVIPASLNPRPRQEKDVSLIALEQETLTKQFGLDESANLEQWLNDADPSRSVPDDSQDGLDMVMPEGLTVRKVAELYGVDEKIEVIDVKSQNGETRKWTMKRWADYYESTTEAKVIRNVISLEVSRSRLGRLIRRPQIVRDLDLQDSVWPEELLNKGEFPNVQFYCLMSVADCFTDFHIDFGGSSVFYHILKGKKTFLFIPPKEKHLKKYEEWCKSPAQNWTFLPDQTKECYRVDLAEGDTMLIPSGWIHAVWTPEDSLVIGGNFLTRMNYGLQFRVHQIEKATGVARKFRYPHFQKLHWFTVFQYLETDPLPPNVRSLLEGGFSFDRNVPTSHKFNEWGENSTPGPENYHARYYSQAELDGLPELLRYILRTALIDNGSIVDGISADVRNAVKKSIPRSHGDPTEIVKAFAIWCVWKRGNEPIPPWAYPEAEISGTASDKMSVAISRKLAEEAALRAPRRQSQRMQAQKEATVSDHGDSLADSILAEVPPSEPMSPTAKRTLEQMEDQGANDSISPASKRPRLSSGSTGSQRKTACDSCRRRRRACKHKDMGDTSSSNISNDVAPSTLVHKEALLNGSALQEKLSSLGGLFNALKSEVNQNSAGNALPTHDSRLSDQSHDHVSTASYSNIGPTMLPLNDDISGDASVTSDIGGGPRPRTKACNHCRKSKRRCIHDAFGNEDPVKVAESAVPRPHARKINKGEHLPRSQAVSPELDHLFVSTSIYDLPSMDEVLPEAVVVPIVNMIAAPASAPSRHDEMLDGGRSFDAETCGPRTTRSERTSTASRDHDMQNKQKMIAVEDGLILDPFLTHGALAVGGASPTGIDSRSDTFDKAASTLVSPPASSDDTSGVSPPRAHVTPSKSRSHSRESSPSRNRNFQRYTPESGLIRKPSHAPSQGRNSEQDMQRSKKRRSVSVPEADEESLRLIKQLQAQDLGLRRRGKA